MRILSNGRTMKHSLVLLAVASLALGACGEAKETEDDAAAVAAGNSMEAGAIAAMDAAEAAADATANTSVAAVATEPEGDYLTGPQRNAVRSATSYLNMTGFSRDGLIDQLSSDAGEGYSVADATAAVDSLDVDWNANAVMSATEYLNMTGFSCKGLVEQLSSSYGSQYTVAQARYGAQQAGAC